MRNLQPEELEEVSGGTFWLLSWGHGKGHGKDDDHGKGHGKDRDDDHGKGHGKDRDDDHGKGHGKGGYGC